MRVHRSYIVALDKIEQIERNQLIINNQRINISEAYPDHFRKFMDAHQFL
ncbi:LytTR family transcriptional regulator DNA-binding domain-containing protein [Chryseobacterium taklimakanense]|nr:LytTR family transcriptional regulator DNA-binding domain-containing protein [Chryseobacterium taklimakanense]